MPAQKKRNRRSGFGSIRQLPSGRYQARYRGGDEKNYTAPSTFTTKGEAEGYLAAVARSLELGTWEPPEVVQARRERNATTLASYFELILKRRGYPATTEGTYRSIFRNRIHPRLGNLPLVEIDRAKVMDWWVDMCSETPKTRKRNADAYALLAMIFHCAVDDGLVEVSPVHIKGAGKAPESEQKPLLTLEELQAIVAALPAHYRVAIQIAAWCALRIGEWSELRRKDVALEANGGVIVAARIHVARAVKETATGEKSVGETKGKRQRWVTVPSHLVPMLVEHMDGLDRSSDALLFPNNRGGWTDRRRFNRLLKRAGQTVGRGDISSHDLRHFGATEFMRVGATLSEVMARLGHSTVDSALRYQHATSARDSELANRMPVATVYGSALELPARFVDENKEV